MAWNGLMHPFFRNLQQSTTFSSNLTCYPVAFCGRAELESGGKIILPPSALEQLARLNISFPMLFELSHLENRTHCGVLEFVAEEGCCYIPYWIMQMLMIKEGDKINIKSVTLPLGKFVKFQPQSAAFLDISNPRAVLEKSLRKFSTFTKGDEIMIEYNNKKYYLNVLEVRPSNAISIVETDIEVDFASPPGYTEPQVGSKSSAIDIPSNASSHSSSSSSPATTSAGISFTPTATPTNTPISAEDTASSADYWSSFKSANRLNGKPIHNTINNNNVTSSSPSRSNSNSPSVLGSASSGGNAKVYTYTSSVTNKTTTTPFGGSSQGRPLLSQILPLGNTTNPSSTQKSNTSSPSSSSSSSFSGQGYSLK